MKTVCRYNLTAAAVGCCLLAAGRAAELNLADSRGQLAFLNSGKWTTGEVMGREALILDVPGTQRPPVRRPGEFALLESEGPVGGFTVTAATLMPAEIRPRDICLIFGYQDDTHFYYAHISSMADPRHNVIMRVDGASRTRINREAYPETRLTSGWTVIRVAHSERGAIAVYVNDLETPLLTAQDQAFPPGKIGFGSFDDRAAFAALSY